MPQITKPNINESWICSGTSDTLDCYFLPTDGLKGIQIESPTLTMESITITAYGLTGASKVVSVPAASGHICSVGGEGFALSRITLTNAPAGTHVVRLCS